MKKSTLFPLLLLSTLLTLPAAAQQPVEGSSYFLPKTAVRLTLLIEKESYTPGEFALYADRYLRKSDVKQEAETNYRIVDFQLQSYGVPDTAKQYTALMDQKHSIKRLDKDDSGILIGINAEGKRNVDPVPFKPAPKAKTLNPRDYMSEEILSAGSRAKMAELCAREIYDIRDSRNQLTRGEAETMPKDGEQLNIMLRQLDTQEQALRQLFEGTTTTDTVEHVFSFIPEKETEQTLLFRFSRKLGLVDGDDLAGSPYYVNVKDMHVMPNFQLTLDNTKKSKDDVGINVNRPGKIKLSLLAGDQRLGEFDLYAAQFGTTEALSGELFSKKVTTHVILSPVTGNAETLEVEEIKK